MDFEIDQELEMEHEQKMQAPRQRPLPRPQGRPTPQPGQASTSGAPISYGGSAGARASASKQPRPQQNTPTVASSRPPAGTGSQLSSYASSAGLPSRPVIGSPSLTLGPQMSESGSDSDETKEVTERVLTAIVDRMDALEQEVRKGFQELASTDSGAVLKALGAKLDGVSHLIRSARTTVTASETEAIAQKAAREVVAAQTRGAQQLLVEQEQREQRLLVEREKARDAQQRRWLERALWVAGIVAMLGLGVAGVMLSYTVLAYYTADVPGRRGRQVVAVAVASFVAFAVVAGWAPRFGRWRDMRRARRRGARR